MTRNKKVKINLRHICAMTTLTKILCCMPKVEKKTGTHRHEKIVITSFFEKYSFAGFWISQKEFSNEISQ